MFKSRYLLGYLLFLLYKTENIACGRKGIKKWKR